ncbi:MAG: NADPH:quinone reductase [Firmicutes bacterium]|nr:NADPH:quinone reductase [Alicyclobacillaceae bacterium]MCL6498166.1 NADPH:quinone reductase [Bacillota bacterium]
MRVVVAQQPGGPEVLQVVERELRAPGPHEVQVRLEAIGINPIDRAIREGRYPASFPWVPGVDGAGEVTAIGSAVERVKVGDRVYVSGGGTYAEAVTTAEENVWPLPPSFSFEQGAAIGVPYVTALRALWRAQVAPGDWVLVHGASGGVGTAAIQLGTAMGLRVAGTASSDAGRSYVLGQGAVAAFGHEAYDAMRTLAQDGFAAILEMRGTENLARDLEVVRRFGTVVVIGASGPTSVPLGALMAQSAAVVGISGATVDRAERMRLHTALGGLLRVGAITPVVAATYRLEEAGAAQEALARGGVLGKLVLIP